MSTNLITETSAQNICTCGYDLRVTGHCGCGKYFSICLECHLPTRANRCVCVKKTRNLNYPEEWR